MYSGSTLTSVSGRILGAHQKIDRCAEKQLRELIGKNSPFPSIGQILHFEGHNGPDAIKRKSPYKDEPIHFFQPNDKQDVSIIHIIESHYSRLVDSLKQGDQVREAFEAAWLAHAVVDGLTPAHHYPYVQKIRLLKDGDILDSGKSIKSKLLLPGTTTYKFLSNNWRFLGPKGLLSTHAVFELGIAILIMPLKINLTDFRERELTVINSENIASWYRMSAQKIASYNMYTRFYSKGWTPSLVRTVKKDLFPEIVWTLTLIWYGAVKESGILVQQ